ncbi:hypothetical protein TNCV_4787131 [Trichonephila clavipes]|nr:hypothetical protein TNCV_4787131 [Trichonephila clavipes]
MEHLQRHHDSYPRIDNASHKFVIMYTGQSRSKKCPNIPAVQPSDRMDECPGRQTWSNQFGQNLLLQAFIKDCRHQRSNKIFGYAVRRPSLQ